MVLIAISSTLSLISVAVAEQYQNPTALLDLKLNPVALCSQNDHKIEYFTYIIYKIVT
jgi:hypothetical protein